LESNWRFGVWDWGFSQSGFRLVARLVTPMGTVTGIAVQTGFSPRFVRLALAPGQTPAIGTPIPFDPDFPIFPYGYDVFPD